MDITRWERIMNKLQSRVERVSGNIAGDLKNVKPFDKEVQNPRERLFNYEQISPQVKQKMSQVDPTGYALTELEMNKLRKRYIGGNGNGG